MPPSFGCDDGMLANFWLCAAGCVFKVVRAWFKQELEGEGGDGQTEIVPPP
jgi:hypothetical protein